MFDVDIKGQDLQQLEAIYRQLDDLKSEITATADRRSRERIKFNRITRFELYALPAKIPLKAYVRDVSIAGVGFLSRRLFKPGEKFVMPFQLRSFDEGKLVLCRITFCRYASSSMYDTGAAFEQARTLVPGPLQIPLPWISSCPGAKVAR